MTSHSDYSVRMSPFSEAIKLSALRVALMMGRGKEPEHVNNLGDESAGPTLRQSSMFLTSYKEDLFQLGVLCWFHLS